MLRKCVSGGATPLRAFATAGLLVVSIAAAVVVMPAATADAAVPVPLVSTTTSTSAGAVVTDGTTLTVNFNKTPVLADSYSLTLTDGTDVGTLSTTAGSLTGVAGVGASIVFTVHGAPAMSVGSALSLSVPLEILETTGVSDGSGDGWDLVASGQVVVDASNNCSTVGFTRVFGGSNCDIGFVDAGPMAPGVFDVIPLPTQDLPGPPDDNAPEVVTNCGPGSTDWVYDVNTEAQLGTNPCGNNPDEAAIGNTNSNTLDYIPTPNLALFEEVGVVETIPGSTYVSGTVVPPQLSAVAVSGDQATFSYYGNVVCESDSTDPLEWSQFIYVTPYTKTNLSPGDLVYATAITCPPPGGGSSITVTWPNPIPASSGVRFKYTGYGPGHSIVGAPGDSSVGEREASESAYAGHGTTIDSFTPQSTTLPTSSGGSVDVALSTTGGTSPVCTLSAVSLPAGAGPLSLPSVSCSGGGPNTITVPANTSYATNVVYTVTLTAAGDAGTPPATDSITMTVPAAPLPVPAVVSAPTITGTAVLGQTLTENQGSWQNNPTSYSYQWEDCDGTGSNCSAIAGATAPTHVVTTADMGHALSVQETASNASGSTTATAAATTTVPNVSTTPAPAPAPAPAPVDVSPPTVSGTPTVGKTLTESHGSWSNAPTAYAYTWERCDNNGNNCVAIAGASAQTDTLTTADVGHTLRVQETASNSSGAGDAATSSRTAPVPAVRTSTHHAAPNTLLLEHQVSSHDHRATFRFKATGTASRFECALVRKPTRRGARTPAPKYVSCRSPKTFTRLEAGSYVLYVRAVGPGGADKTPASYEFKIT